MRRGERPEPGGGTTIGTVLLGGGAPMEAERVGAPYMREVAAAGGRVSSGDCDSCTLGGYRRGLELELDEGGTIGAGACRIADPVEGTTGGG